MCRDYILIGNFLVMAFLPFSLLSTLNYLLYRTIKQSGQLPCGLWYICLVPII